MADTNDDDLKSALGLTPEAVETRLQMIGLDASSRDSLGSYWPTAQESTAILLEQFYDQFISTPDLAAVLGHPSRIPKLILVQTEYLESLFCDPIDAEYVDRRLRIGARHHQLRVKPQWYLAACAHLLCGYIEAAPTTNRQEPMAVDEIDAMVKSLFFDASLVLDAYMRNADLAATSGAAEHTGPHVPTGERSGMPTPSSVNGQRHATAAIRRLRMNESDVSRRATFLGLEDRCLEGLAAAAPAVLDALPGVLQEFYDLIESTADLAGMLEGEQVQRLMWQVRSYWSELLRGEIDPVYATSRMRIGAVHEQLGIPPQLYLAGLARQVSRLLPVVMGRGDDGRHTLSTLFRLVFFDVTFVIDAYMEARASRLLQLRGLASQVMTDVSSAVVVTDRECRVLFANEAFVSMVGIDPGLLYCMELANAIPSMDLEGVVRSVGASPQRRLMLVKKLGDRSLRVTISELEASQPAEGKIAIVLDDVSELVRVGDSFDSTSAQYQRLADVVAAVLWEMDWETRTLVSLSRGALELIGQRDVSLLGRAHAWTTAIYPEDHAAFVAACESLNELTHNSCEYRMVRSDGQIVYVSSHLTRTTSEGDKLRIAAVTTDISQTRSTDRLRLSSLEHFSSNICDVVSTAVASVEFDLQRIAAAPTPPGASDRGVSQALFAVKRVASVLGSLNAFSGRQRLDVQAADLNDLVHEFLAEIKVIAGEECDLELQLAPDLPRCRVDPRRFLVVVSHLIDNARRAASGRVHIVIGTRCRGDFDDIPCPIAHKPDWIELSIADRGRGMPYEVRRRAFEPFYSAFAEPGRYGLGLSIVHGYVTQCGGYLALSSVESEGTTVAMRFPAINGEVEMAAPTNGSAAPAKVLIAGGGDHEISAAVAAAEALGCTVRVARSVALALEVVGRDGMDILISDSALAGPTDGFGLANIAVSYTPHIGSIVLVDAGAANLATHNPASGLLVLTKPVDGEELSTHIQSLLGRNARRVDELARLTAREREVLQHVATGKSQVDIGRLLGISERTVEQHVRAARKKLNAVSTVDAVVQAIGNREIVP
ncbi:Blue-light-activated protein [Posidoniimonas corsicana]|uniref:histidine kinase n=1 Tax=Posidoniimonas corsicana TaxID=1938618 RepID=A0A5C5VE86_9BACT|nr:protoglobin domain-containing protein [Posidoniimonas corsicana]TWT35975.1 Blue-light-activated protein [Posidoniimonas corsicana]